MAGKVKLTEASAKALRECAEAGRLWCTSENRWRWNRTLPNGMVYQAASSPTIYTLQAKGLLKISTANSVEITPAGRALLASSGKDN